MTQRSVLITGCSSGIGLDAARVLKARGWHVFATCRAEADCATLRGEGLQSLSLDLADEASVAAAVDHVLGQTGGRLDALINNGAYASPGAVEDLPRDALRAIFETNLFGQFDLIARVMPAMRAQGAGRIVNVSSVLGFVALRYRGAYCATKYAMEAMTDAMRMEIAGSGIHVCLVEPGPIDTLIRINSRPHFDRWIDWRNSAHRQVYEEKVMPRIYAEEAPFDRFELPCSAVSDKIVHALEASAPHPRYFVTTPTYISNILRRVLPTRLLDRVLGKQ